MTRPLLQKYALEDMHDFVDFIKFEREQIKFYYRLGLKWKKELDAVRESEFGNQEKIKTKEDNLTLLKEVMHGSKENIDYFRELIDRIRKGEFDG